MALPWFFLSLAVVAIFAAMLPSPWNNVLLGAWSLSGVLIFVRPIENLIAQVVFKVRRPVAQEAALMEPLWNSVLDRAGIKHGKFELWVEDSQQVNAFAAAGHIVSVTRWSLEHLPARQLEAVLAHELGHHLGGHSWVRLLSLWYSLPARVLIAVLRFATRIVLFVISLFSFLGFVVGLLMVVGFVAMLYYVAVTSDSWFIRLLVLVPLVAPFFVAWLGRRSELRADRTAAELGYSNELLTVFQSWLEEGQDDDLRAAGIRARLFASHPMVAKRILAMEAWVSRTNAG